MIYHFQQCIIDFPGNPSLIQINPEIKVFQLFLHLNKLLSSHNKLMFSGCAKGVIPSAGIHFSCSHYPGQNQIIFVVHREKESSLIMPLINLLFINDCLIIIKKKHTEKRGLERFVWCEKSN